MTSPQRLQRLEIPTTPGEATVLSVWLVVDMQGKLRVTERKEVSPFRDVPLFSVLVCIEGEPVKEAPQFIESLHEFCKDGKPFAVIYQLPENAIDPCVPLEEDATLPGIDVEVPIDGPIDAMLSIFRERVLVMRVSATSFPGVPLWSEVTAIKGRETEGRLKGTALLNEISRLANAEKQTFTVWVRTPPYADKLNLGRVRLLNERSLVTGVRSPVTVSVVWPRDAAQGALHDDSWAQPLPTESQMLQAMWGAGQVLQDAAAPRMNEAVHLWYTDLGDVPGIAEQNICLGATKESILDGLKRLNTKFEDESVPHPRHAHLVALVGEATPDGGFATASQPMYARELLQALDGCNAQVLIVCDAPGFTCELHYAGTAPQAPNCRITVIGLESVNEGQYHRGGLLCSLCTVYHYGLAVDALNMMAAYLAPTHKLFVASTDPLPQDALCISDPVRQQHGWHKANLQAARSEAEAKARLASLAKALMSDPQQVAYLTDAAKTKAQAEAAYRMLLIKYAGGAEPEEALYTLVVDQVHEMLDNYRVDDDSGEDKEGLINYINGKEFTQHAWDDFVAIYEDMKKQKLRQRIEAVGMRDSVEDMLMCRGVRYLGDVALAAATDVPIALKKPTRAVYVWMKAEGGHAELDEVSPVLRALWSSGVGLMGDADDATWSDLALPSRRLVHLPLNPEGLTGKSVLLEHPGFLPPTKEEIVKAIEWLAEDTTADDSLLIVLLGDAGADGGYHTLSGTLHERDIFAPLQGVHPDAHVTLISDTTSPVGRMHFNEEAVPPKLPCHFVAFGYDPDESQARHTVGDIFIPYAMAMAHDTCTIRTSSELRGFDKALNLICAAVPHQVVVFCTSSGPLKSHTNVIGNHRVLHESGQNWYKAFLGPFNHEDSSGMGYLMEVGWLCHRHAEHLDDVEARLQNQYGGRWSAGIRELAKLYLHGPLHVVNDVWHFVNQLSRSPLTAEGAEEVCRRVLSQDMWDEIVASFHKTHGRSLCNKLLNLDDSIANRFLARGLFFQRHGEYFCTAVPETAAYARSTPTSAPSGLRSAGSAIGVGAGQEAPEMVRNASQQSDSDAGSRYVQQQSLRSNNGAAPTASLQQSLRSNNGAAPTAVLGSLQQSLRSNNGAAPTASLQQSLRSDSGAAPTAIAPDAVTVTVLGATGLPDKDLIGKSDPYAVLEMDGFPKAQTKTVDGTHEPVWNKEVHYDLTKLPLYAPSDTLTMGITVYDQDVGGRDLLGKGALLLTPQLLQRSVDESVEHVGLSHGGVVQCMVKVHLMATQTSMPAPPPSPPPVAALSPSGHNVCHVGVQAFASQTSVPSRREPEPMKEEPARQASMGVPSAVGSLPAEEERVGSGGAPYMTSRLSPLRYASPVSPREGFDALFLTDMPAPFNKITPTFALKTPSASQRQPSQSLSPPLMPPEPSILREMDFRPLSMPQPASPVPAKRVSGTDPTATLPRNMGSVINLTRPSGAAAFRSPLPPPSTTYRKPNFNHVNSQL
eukprot:TRINITY_DN3336_c0_g1_i1.p1 TRINITY_DN3336_c0_g1~~TRINITY_DN3336_c0_g1_i1.p1  ORF type:complete len:1494 (+),score=390.04 TRINITY_DN3336_c0_g1_i1:81-4562(+)